jgi:hypothetical protein
MSRKFFGEFMRFSQILLTPLKFHQDSNCICF